MLYLIKDTDARQVVGGTSCPPAACLPLTGQEHDAPTQGKNVAGAEPAPTPASSGNQ